VCVAEKILLMRSGLASLASALGIWQVESYRGSFGDQHLSHDLLLLNQESTHNPVPDSLVTENTTISSANSPLPLEQTGLLLVCGRTDTLQMHTSDGALGDRGPLLLVLDDYLATRSLDHPNLVRFGVVRQATPVSNSLHHL